MSHIIYMQRHELGRHSEQFTITKKLPYLLLKENLARGILVPVAGDIAQNARELFARIPESLGVGRVIDVVSQEKPFEQAARHIGQTALSLGVGLDNPQIVYTSGLCFYGVVVVSEREAILKKDEEKSVVRRLAEAKQNMAHALEDFTKEKKDSVFMSVGMLIGSKTGGLVDEDKLSNIPQLTDREREMLHMLVSGFLNKQIAQQLGLAESTIRNNFGDLYAKLGVQNRTEAVAKVLLQD